VKGIVLLGKALGARPFGTILGFGLEYAGYAAACAFAGVLLVTRFPLAYVDRVSGLQLRERIIDGVARVSPG
jgi:hypothetical protein